MLSKKTFKEDDNLLPTAENATTDNTKSGAPDEKEEDEGANVLAASGYIAKMRYGEGARDDSDENSNEYPELADRTPNTRRKEVHDL